MPTCSQAKIINNLETDLHKRLHSLSNQEIDFNPNVSLNDCQPVPSRITVEYFRRQNLGTPYVIDSIKDRRLNSRRSSRKSSYKPNDRFLIAQLQGNLKKKLPSISADCLARKGTVPAKFMSNAAYKNKSETIVNLSTSSGKTPSSDIEENYSTARINSDGHSSNSWSTSTENLNQMPIYNFSTRNNLRKEQALKTESERPRKSSLINNLQALNTLPKLALEIEAIENMEPDDCPVDDCSMDQTQNDMLNKRRDSVNAVKRLLSLASIRPSKTFHKEITTKETEVLKRYYEVLKPRGSITTGSTQVVTNIKNENQAKSQIDQIPILYDSAKINLESLNYLDKFLKEHKSAINEGKLVIEYNTPGHNGFVLKDKETDEVTKFPHNSHDTFVALVISKSARDNANLNENHILQAVNWNDRGSMFPRKQSKTERTNSKKQVQAKVPEPVVNLEAIKSICDLVSSTVDSKLTKQVIYNGMDLSNLPGGINFEMPPCYEFCTESDTKQQSPGKLKNTVYKKLKNKLEVTRVMYFTEAPVSKPLSIVFELNGFDVGHTDILDATSKSLLNDDWKVTELEFVPRSVHFGSVFVDNLWIVAVNAKDAKYFLISHGIIINDQKIMPKSHDEFMNTEYERYIRAEKYRELIKNHEKAMSNQSKIRK